MQLLSAQSRHSSTPWLLTPLLATLPRTLALPLCLGRRLSTISPEFDFVDLHITDAFGADTFSTSVFTSLNSPAAGKTPTGEDAHYTVLHPDAPPALSAANMFSSPGSWQWQQPQSSSIGPLSLTATLQTTLDRLLVGARYNLGLPLPLAFLAGVGVLFLFVLSSLFSVFLLWETARGVVGAWRRREKRKGNEGREFVIRSRVVVRPSPMRGILSPVGSRRSSSGESGSGSEGSPCAKRVRWVDEEREGAISAESFRIRVKGDGDLAACGVGNDFDVEMEKVD